MLLLFFFTRAQNNSDPEIIFDTTIYNFRVIDRGSNAECIFTFINKRQTPIVISQVKASCGCTAPTWSKEPIKPNASGNVRVKYNTNTVGTFIKTVAVYTNRSKEPIILTIKGEVKKKNKKA